MSLQIFVGADLKADLYVQALATGQGLILLGETVIGDSPLRYYVYDPTSSVTDDGENFIKPTGIVGNGRFIKQNSALWKADWTQSNSTSPDYIQNKPTLATVATTGAYSDLSGKPTSAKKQEAFSGTTNSSGNYTVTFGTSYSVAPNIQGNIIGGSNTNIIKITSITTTGFTVNVVNRTDTLGLLPSYANVNGAAVDVIVTEK